MDEPTQGPTETTASGAPEGGWIGVYRLIHRVGVGGMGEVWLAEQHEPVRRRVALKLIKLGMDTAHVVARFEAERQALALMEHPAVARVLDAGSTAAGRPYFVMEYVPGVPITEHCDRNKLSTRERLELFLEVCRGVQHAHQKAVIHRDLKPSNVLVAMQDERAVPKIIDFGIAKAIAQRLTERTLYTEHGEMIGTPSYMSPEQIDPSGQDVDTRADVYSLGVMLYEILVGARPFPPAYQLEGGIDQLRRKILEEDPKRPSTRLGTLDPADSGATASRRGVDVPTLRRQLRGELDWIVMKALEKDRTRRYGSPAELAADIENYLHDKPVLAGPPSTRYRARKFVRRHRIGVAFASAGLVALIAFAVAMAVQSARVARERDRANREATTANRALTFLTDLFEVSNPGEARGNAVTAREILDRGAARIEELHDEPVVQARLLETLGRVYESLGLSAAALPLSERALKLRREVLGPDHPDAVLSLDDVGNILQSLGKLDEAEAYVRESLERRRRTLGNDARDTATSMNNLGLLLRAQGKLDEAATILRECLDTKRRILPKDDPEILPTLNNYALVLQNLGRYAEAEPYFRDLVDGCRRIEGADHPHTLTALANMGLLLQSEGKLDEAERCFREVLDTRRRVLGNDHQQTLLSAYLVAFVLRSEGKLDEAEGYFRESLDGSRRTLGPDHPRTLMSIHGMGLLRHAQGRFPEAESYFRDALAARRAKLGDDHNDTIDSIQGLAWVLLDERKLDEAAALYGEAIERSTRTLGTEHFTTLNAVAGLADVRVAQGRAAEAEPTLAGVVATAKRLGPLNRATARSLAAQGRCLLALGRADEAKAALAEASRIAATAEPLLLPRIARSLK
jgi:serine/threonine protein kinase/tetratricopeptide (TPR) repeat protein